MPGPVEAYWPATPSPRFGAGVPPELSARSPVHLMRAFTLLWTGQPPRRLPTGWGRRGRRRRASASLSGRRRLRVASLAAADKRERERDRERAQTGGRQKHRQRERERGDVRASEHKSE